MIRIEPVRPEQQTALSNMLQKYLYEMTQYYDDPMDDEGNFDYPWLRYYFTEPGRQAYFILDNDRRAGFALVNTHSWTGEPVDNSLAEFTVFPAFRRNGSGMAAVDALFAACSGSWQLKYSTDNIAGAAFWKKVTAKYNGTETRLEGMEIAVTFRA